MRAASSSWPDRLAHLGRGHSEELHALRRRRGARRDVVHDALRGTSGGGGARRFRRRSSPESSAAQVPGGRRLCKRPWSRRICRGRMQEASPELPSKGRCPEAPPLLPRCRWSGPCQHLKGGLDVLHKFLEHYVRRSSVFLYSVTAVVFKVLLLF
ncbi:uncharacterized protein [Lolium perenne]|uniref:uncharacterized protein n=1 Tax=Lolium perenne TaxID=4522 RepID=UPI003A993008